MKEADRAIVEVRAGDGNRAGERGLPAADVGTARWIENRNRPLQFKSICLYAGSGRPDLPSGLSPASHSTTRRIFRYDVRAGRPKKHALHSLAPGPLEATYRDRLAWTPEDPGVEWKAFPEAPPPAAVRNERLIQMRLLARRFRASLTEPGEKVTDLRLAPRPLFEYTAPKAGVTDGAIFSFIVATDPEAVLLIEATDEGGKAGFRFAFARFHYWRLTARLGDKTVWDVDPDPSMPLNNLGDPRTMKRVYNSFHAGTRK